MIFDDLARGMWLTLANGLGQTLIHAVVFVGCFWVSRHRNLY